METDTLDYDMDELETQFYNERPLSIGKEQQTLPVRSIGRRRLDRELDTLNREERRRRHTLIGFAAALSVLTLLLLGLNFLDISPYVRQPQRESIPIQLLQFGIGTSNLPSAGNLTSEGAVRKARQNPDPLEDARPAMSKSEATASVKLREYTQPSFVQPVKDDAKTSEKPTKLADNATSKTDIGSSTAPTTSEGEGLGRFGSGTGRGQGYSLDWGGGGNRVVLHKELPKYPAGIIISAQIKMRITVSPNGNVGMILPMQKGEPALERAAMEALRRWQFNPTSDGKDMIGFITFTFRIQ